jgi:hypothetical protein
MNRFAAWFILFLSVTSPATRTQAPGITHSANGL